MALSIALVGCGGWGRNILRDLVACGATVNVVAPLEDTRRKALAAGAASACATVSELGPVDGVVIATPSSTHAAVIDQALPLGKPIFVEKPMTADIASARRLVKAASGRLFVMEKWRYHPGIEYIRTQVKAGAVGEIQAVHLTRWGWGRPHQDTSAIWTLMPHDLAITLHWLGYVPPLRSVVATTPLAFDCGMIAQLGGGSHPLVTIDMSIVSPVHRRTFTVVGSKASMDLGDSYAREIAVRPGTPGQPGPEERVPISQDMPLLLELQAFLAHLRGGPPPMTSAEEDLAIVERVAEIEAAARTSHDGKT